MEIDHSSLDLETTSFDLFSQASLSQVRNLIHRKWPIG